MSSMFPVQDIEMAGFVAIDPAFGSQVPGWVLGNEEANEMLSDVYSGSVSIEQARRWSDELRAEGFALLAAALESRLPKCQ